MIRSFENLIHLDPGFRARHVLVLRTPLRNYSLQSQRTAFYDRVLEKVGAPPGVWLPRGYTTWVPLTN